MERFDVLLHDVVSEATISREWRKSELLASVAWLKRMNAKGNNIYIRPSGEHGLALLDALKTVDLASMRGNGFAPAINIEIPGDQFQAWVKLAHRPLPDQLRRLAEAGLARAFGGTTGRVISDGFGWLAGFAAQGDRLGQPKRKNFVLAHTGSVEIGKQTIAYLEHVIKALQRPDNEPKHDATVPRNQDRGRSHPRDR